MQHAMQLPTVTYNSCNQIGDGFGVERSTIAQVAVVLEPALTDDLFALGILQAYKTVLIDVLPRCLLVYVAELHAETCIDKVCKEPLDAAGVVIPSASVPAPLRHWD